MTAYAHPLALGTSPDTLVADQDAHNPAGQMAVLITMTPTAQPPAAIVPAGPSPTPASIPSSELRQLANQMQRTMEIMADVLSQMQTQQAFAQSPIGIVPTAHSHQHAGATPVPGATPTAVTPPGMGSGGMMCPMMAASGSQATWANPAIRGGALTQSMQIGDFTMTITPINLRVPGVDSFDFYIVLDSQSNLLNQDLAQLTSLQLPSGKIVAPARWTGPLGGNHIEGTLSFPRIDDAGLPVVLAAEGMLSLNLGDAQSGHEHVFLWDLKEIH